MATAQPRNSPDSPTSPFSNPRFNQYPSPTPDGARRPSTSGRSHSRRESTTSVNSISGTLNSSGQRRDGSISESGLNAISNLLQNPIVRTGLVPQAVAVANAHKPPSAKDIPPVTLTNIPAVDAAAFRPYLSQVGSLYDAFQRGREEGGERGSQLFRGDKDSRKNEDSAGLRRQQQQRRPSGSRAPLASSPDTVSLESPPSRAIKSGGNVRRPGNVTTPLSTIPSVYFEQDFRLENPRTFDVVSERSEVIRPVLAPLEEDGTGLNGSAIMPGIGARKALATNAILQEKLSWYMDTVEVHLISSISTASTSFFAALGSLRALHAEAEDSVTRIKRLRECLERLDQDMAQGGLKIARMRRRRENLRKLGEAVMQLRHIVEDVTKCEDLVEKGDVELAIDGVEALERLIAGEEKQSPGAEGHNAESPATIRDLRGTNALNGATEKLHLLRFDIGKTFEARFLDVLLGDLRRHVEEVPPHETLQRWASAAKRSRGDHSRKPSSLPAYLNLDVGLRSSLLSHLRGLNRSHHTMPGTTAYRDSVLREIKSLIRRHLPSSNDDDNESMASVSTRGGRELNQQEKSSILARNLRELEPEAAEELLVKIYTGIGEVLRRLGVQVKVLLDVTSGLSSPPTSGTIRSPSRRPSIQMLDGYVATASPTSTGGQARMQEELHQVLDMSSLLGQAVDIAQTQITKLLKVRAEQTAHLSISRFLRYFTVNRLFADECEAVSGRGGTALKTVVNGHIKGFVTQMGDSERQRLAQVMDADVWDARDFGDTETAILSRISDASTRDAEDWTKSSTLWEHESDTAKLEAEPIFNGTATPSGKDRVRSAVLDEQKFILPSSAIAVINGIERFEHLTTGIPSMAQEIASSILEYLKLFNSRSCQLILGAGATRSAGLKNITTKHLAIASQALSFIINLIPYIREFVRRHSPGSGGVTSEFDKVKRLFQDHQAGIHDKLVEIMSGRAAVHVSAMKKIDWDDISPEQPNVNTYMETLTKETNTLHRVLSKHLPPSSLQDIMNPVFRSYREQWGKAYEEVAVKSPRGIERMLRDAELLKNRLSKLENANGLGDFLLEVIRGKDTGAQHLSAEPHKDGAATETTTKSAGSLSSGHTGQGGETGKS